MRERCVSARPPRVCLAVRTSMGGAGPGAGGPPGAV